MVALQCLTKARFPRRTTPAVASGTDEQINGVEWDGFRVIFQHFCADAHSESDSKTNVRLKLKMLKLQ